MNLRRRGRRSQAGGAGLSGCAEEAPRPGHSTTACSPVGEHTRRRGGRRRRRGSLHRSLARRARSRLRLRCAEERRESAAKKKRERAASRIGSSSPTSATVSPPPFYLLPRPFSLLGLTRGGDGKKLGLGFDFADSVFCTFDFFLFRSSEWETRVRVRVPTLLFFLLPLLPSFEFGSKVFSYPKGFRSRVLLSIFFFPIRIRSVSFFSFLTPT